MKLFGSLICVLLLSATQSAVAGPGHDHGDAPAATTGAASPRFETHSGLFEVVGMVEGSGLALTIDRYATNAPVLNAKVELESGAYKAVGKFNAEHGDYDFAGLTFAKPGTYPISVTITVGDDVDILAGNLVIPDPEAGHTHETTSVKKWLPWAGGGLALMVVAFFVVGRMRRPARYGVSA